MRDLASLEAVALATGIEFYTQPDPGDINEPAYRQALRHAVDVAESGAGGWGSPQCSDAVFGTVGGRAAYLFAVLRAHAGLNQDDVVALAESITVEQWGKLDRYAFGVDFLREIVERVDREIGITIYPDEAVPWSKAVIETWKASGLTIEQIGDLTLPAFRLIRSGGDTAAAWGEFDLDNSGEAYQVYTESVAPRREAFYNEGKPGAVAWNEWEKLLPVYAESNGHGEMN